MERTVTINIAVSNDEKGTKFLQGLLELLQEKDEAPTKEENVIRGSWPDPASGGVSVTRIGKSFLDDLPPVNDHTRWTEEETEELISKYLLALDRSGNGRPSVRRGFYDEMSEHFKRTKQSISMRIHNLKQDGAISYKGMKVKR